MILKWPLSFLFLFVFCVSGVSQDFNDEVALESPRSGWHPNALYVQFGGVEGGRYISDFNLIKGFIDIENMPGVQQSDFKNMGYYSIGMGSGMQMLMSHPSNRPQIGRVTFDWRYGIFGGSQQIAYAEFNEQDTFSFDTLVSVATGEEFLVDSVVARDWRVSSQNVMIGLKTEYIARFLTKRRAEFYLGAGLAFGLLTNATTEYDYWENYYTQMRDGRTFNDYDLEGRESLHYSYRQVNGNGWLASLNVPAGVSINLGKKREFWKKLYLNFEMAPSITLLSTLEGGSALSSGFNFVSGLRINI
jgi:hypothetical protein